MRYAICDMGCGNKNVMRRLSLICATVLIVFLMRSSVFAIQFCKDFLEPGNEGGISGLKTFDGEWVVGVDETVEVDVWINDIIEPLLTTGFWVLFDASLLTIEMVDAFDNIDLPGPWDHLMTRKAPNPRGPGYLFACGNLSGVSPDGCGDTLIARITFRCTSPGNALITFTTIPGFDSVVGFSGTLYDPEMVLPFNLFTSNPPNIPQFPFCSIKVE